MATQSEFTNAFDGIMPQSALPSCPSSSSSQYDIFINHRGPDVKHTLATRIYNTLHRHGLRVFFDEKEFELGDSIPLTLQEAMHSASVHIAIFSRTYAQSPWCLAELSFMLQIRAQIIPVFYLVDPSDLRRLDVKKGIYADAFVEHKRKNRYSSEKLQKWKMALEQISYQYGITHIDNDDEDKLLMRIVDRALEKANKTVPLEAATYPVGLDEAMKDFNSKIESSQTDGNVQIVGIVGMGGSGKTTLATEIYNRKCSYIHRSSFLPQVRDAASKNALHNLQWKLLGDLLPRQPPAFNSVMEGKGIMARTLRSMTMLIVLDDVDDVDQMHALLPAKHSFRRGSFILVTTRERGVLKSYGIPCIYEIRPLNPFYAKQLFCKHAFVQPYSKLEFESLVEDFKDLIEKFLDACKGLPLSLKVLGAQLNGQAKDYWESQLPRIFKILPTEIKERLQVSYDALDREQKEIFLDIACFFIGEQPDLAITVWDGAGWSGLHGWKTLVNKCLVEVDELNRIKMHDQLRDLGREIAREHSPYRLWFPEQREIAKGHSPYPLRFEQGMPIRGIMGATADTLEDCMEIMRITSGRSKRPRLSSPGLQLLDVKENDLTEKFSSLLRDLVWLRWSRFPEKNLPLWLSPANLRVLELCNAHHLEELWDDNVDPPSQLRELIISADRRFKSLPRSIGSLKHLKKLVLLQFCPIRSLPEEFCFLQALEHLELQRWGELSSLPTGFGNLAKLRHLNLNSCRKLMLLPDSFGNLTNLRHLNLNFCWELRTLPDSFKQLKNLQYLNLSFCGKLTLTSKISDILENMTNLESLRLSDCRELQELPHLRNQTSLRELFVAGMSFTDVPSSIGDLRKLEVLEIGNKLFTSLPTFIENMSSLTRLSIFGCKRLESLPPSLVDLQIACKALESLPDSIGNLSCLTHLLILGCDKLQSLPDSVGHLNNLKYLVIEHSGVEFLPETLGQSTSLQTLEIISCPLRKLAFKSGSSSFFCKCKLKIHLKSTQLSKISISEDCCPSLESLELHNNEYLTDINTLPRTVKAISLSEHERLKNCGGIRGLTELQNLSISFCPELDELPSLEGLTSVKEISIEGCPKVEKIQGFQHLRSLEALSALTCWKESGIESLEQAEKLRRLVLVADSRSAIEPCIQKWPGELLICGRALCGVKSVVESLAFPNLDVTDSTYEMSHVQVQCPESRPFIVCFVINSFSEAPLWVNSEREYYRLAVKEGMWVVIGMFTQDDCSLIPKTLSIKVNHNLVERAQYKVEKGMLVTGQEWKLREAFKRFLTLLEI